MNTNDIKSLAASVRSKLFVPGSRPELFAKATGGKADALSFDLEDSVVPAMKAQARAAVAAFLRGTETSAKLQIVRVNGIAGGLFADDIKSIAGAGVHVINVPKVESRQDVLDAVEAIERAESKTSGMATGILANIESPKGLRLACEIASAHPRVVGLQIGFVDLSLACGIVGTNATALNAVRMAVRLAASEAGIAAFDGAYPDVKDVAGFRAQAEEARALGLNGKSCIHPSQVSLANEVFAPTPELVQHSARVVHAADEAAAQGTGAFLLDGKMVDLPIVERARRVLARAELYGMLTGANGA